MLAGKGVMRGPESSLQMLTSVVTSRSAARSGLLPTKAMTISSARNSFSRSLSHSFALLSVSWRDGDKTTQ